MVKVLQVIDGKSFGGITKLMLDIKKIINNNIQFDLLTGSNICKDCYNLNIVRNNFKNKTIYNYRLYKFLKKHNYDVVHINSGAFFYVFQVAFVCKMAGIKRIIVHSHNTPKVPTYKKVLIKLLNPLFCKMVDVKLSCSKEASKSLFTNAEGVKIIKNGINVEQLKYDEKIRNKYREDLCIGNKIVYGHVGRFDKQKNHEFLINLFYEIQKVQDSILLLVGTGELESNIKENVKKLNMEDKVVFLGFKEDIGNWLSCMDYFLFPSLYEGLGIVLIEAQTSGLPVFVSNSIPSEANITKNFYRINTFNINEWISKIFSVKLSNRKDSYLDTIKAGYDITNTCNELEKIYLGEK